MKKIVVFFASLAIFCLTSCKKEVSCKCSRYDFQFGREDVSSSRTVPFKDCKEYQKALNEDYDDNSRYGMYNCMESDK